MSCHVNSLFVYLKDNILTVKIKKKDQIVHLRGIRSQLFLIELHLLDQSCQRLPVSESLLFFSLLGLSGLSATVPRKKKKIHSVPLIRGVIPKGRGSGKEQGGLYKTNK